MVTQEVEENDHCSVWQEITGGGDPAKSDRLSVGAAKNVVFVRGPSGVVRENRAACVLNTSDRREKPRRSTAKKRFSRDLRQDP